VSAISVSGLTKRYGDIVAVDDLSLDVESGEILVLLGPNGAGKTTTVEIIEGLRAADAGTVEVLGSRPGAAQVRKRMGAMPQRGDLYAGIRTEEALRLFAAFYDDAEDPNELLERLDLGRVRRSTYRRLSGGEKRRLSLGLALIGKPALLFLDEPTAEMDIEGRQTTWEMVGALRKGGTTVLLTTHQLDEAERVADRVAIIKAGKLVALGTPDELGGISPSELTFTLATPIDVDVLSNSLGETVVALDDGTYRVVGAEPDPTLVSRLTTWLAARGVLVRTLRAGPRSLEEVYLELTR
jgi:ABC-2 type transport system ATP-binding protein